MAGKKSGESSDIEKHRQELSENLQNDERHKFNILIFQLFDSQRDPYQYLLQLAPLEKSEQNCKEKNVLLHEILFCFVVWANESAVKPPLGARKKSALQWAMMSRNGNVLEVVSKIFQIDGTKHLHVFEEQLKKGNIEMVAHAVKLYNLQENYNFQKLYFPLLCFDLKKELKNCLSESKNLRLQFVHNLDKLLCRRRVLDEAIKSVHHKFPKRKFIKKDMIYYKRAMDGFIKEWHIPLEKCANFIKDKKCTAIYHLVSRYKKKEISPHALAELAAIIVRNNNELKSVMIRKLKFDPMAVEAVMFKLKNPSQHVPTNLVTSDVDNSSSEFLSFGLGASHIIFVNDRKTYDKSVKDISKCKEIGFDAEWQPTFGWSTEKIALLQIATWNKVYLFDVLSLSKCLSNDWTSLVTKILHNASVMKVGYGTETDLEIFKEKFLGNRKDLVAKKFENFLDLRNFFTWVSKTHPEIIKNLVSANGNDVKDFEENGDNGDGSDENDGDGKGSDENDGDGKGSDRDGNKTKSSGKKDVQNNKKRARKNSKLRGLSGLCLLVLGKPLSKFEQMSDWAQRPLRNAQMLYAALDAFCLLQILERLEYVLYHMRLNKVNMIKKFFAEEPPAAEKNKEKPEAGESKSSKKQEKTTKVSSASSCEVVESLCEKI